MSTNITTTKTGSKILQDVNAIKYILNDVDDYSQPNTKYLGKENSEGDWQIVKIVEGSGMSFYYASKKNNPNITNYNDAFSNRLTLNYTKFSSS
jgi:hypothetical protein